MVLRPHRSRLCPNKSVPPGQDGSDFFLPIFISSHPSAALLADLLLLPGYSHIHIAPLLAPLPSTRMGWEVMSAIRLTGGCDVVLASCGDGWRR